MLCPWSPLTRRGQSNQSSRVLVVVVEHDQFLEGVCIALHLCECYSRGEKREQRFRVRGDAHNHGDSLTSGTKAPSSRPPTRPHRLPNLRAPPQRRGVRWVSGGKADPREEERGFTCGRRGRRRGRR